MVCKSYCVEKYFNCYKDHHCAKPDTESKIQICHNEYIACMKKCLYELYVLEERTHVHLKSDEEKALLKKFKKELAGKRRGNIRFND